MKDSVKKKLMLYAPRIPVILSDPRQNPNNTEAYRFELDRIMPLSEDAAAIICRNMDTGKKVAVFAWWTGARWWRLVPTDSHVLGMLSFPGIKGLVEAENFDIITSRLGTDPTDPFPEEEI